MGSLLILLFIPAFFLLMFGYALNFDIRHVALAVEDGDHWVEFIKVFPAIDGVRSDPRYAELLAERARLQRGEELWGS